MQRFLLLYLGIELARKQAPQLRPMRLWFALASLHLSQGGVILLYIFELPHELHTEIQLPWDQRGFPVSLLGSPAWLCLDPAPPQAAEQ